MAIIIMMILPVPSYALDLGVAVSFALAITIFVITLFIEKPLDFSSFPAVLVASLLLRLSLNVSSTKLILSEGHTGTDAAGNIIKAFAQFFMGGSLLLGIIAFTVILIVNFLVITKGATRMAEVGARFALDAMPGRQLAIDSDVAAGAITHEEARQRRSSEQAEASFLGSLDGASKFVKGDAIAGLLITALNIVAGVSVGYFVHDLSISSAFEVYAILTVGDGLVTQIPGVIISIAAGLLLARSGLTEKTGNVLVQQIAQFPSALLVVSGVLLIFALSPGMPFVPFLLLGTGAGIGYLLVKKTKNTRNERVVEATQSEETSSATSIRDMLEVDDIHLEISQNIISDIFNPATGLEPRIDGLRQHIARSYGLLLPEVRITDNPALENDHYRIWIQGAEAARGQVKSHHFLLLEQLDNHNFDAAISVEEPVFRTPAIWVPNTQKEQLRDQGLNPISVVEVISTHLSEAIKGNLQKLLTRRQLNELLDAMCEVSDAQKAESNRRLVSELIPDRITKELLLTVLSALLEEEVTIRNLPKIIEAVSQVLDYENSSDAIIEKVRQSLKEQITETLKVDAEMPPLVQMDPEWEEIFLKHSNVSKGYPQVALPKQVLEHLISEIVETHRKLETEGSRFLLLASEVRRRFLFRILQSRSIKGSVLSYEEVIGEQTVRLGSIIGAPSKE